MGAASLDEPDYGGDPPVYLRVALRIVFVLVLFGIWVYAVVIGFGGIGLAVILGLIVVGAVGLNVYYIQNILSGADDSELLPPGPNDSVRR